MNIKVSMKYQKAISSIQNQMRRNLWMGGNQNTIWKRG